MQRLSTTEINSAFPLAHCRELSMFGALSQDSVQFLLEQGQVLRYEQGERLFSCAEQSDRFYIVLAGTLGYYRYEAEQRIHIRDFKMGEQLGFVGMIGLHERRGDAQAQEISYVLEISCELFHKVCEAFAGDFVIFLINMTRDMSREITDLDALCTRLSANQRQRNLV